MSTIAAQNSEILEGCCRKVPAVQIMFRENLHSKGNDGPIMIDKWCQMIIMKFDSMCFVVVCEDGTFSSNAEHNSAIIYVVDDFLRDG